MDSDALALLTVALDGARLVLACATANSPAANPVGLAPGLADGLADGLGDGLGLGLGDGLPTGVAVGLATGTDKKLAPVDSVSVAVDSVVIVGES